MKKMIWLIFVIAMTGNVYAQETFFPKEEGVVHIYAQKDGKGKIKNYVRQTVQKVEETGGNLSISYLTELLDKTQKPLKKPVEIPCKVVICNGVLILDMKTMFNDFLKGEMPDNVEVSGTAMEIPSDLQPGQSLKDADIDMKIGFIKMKIVITEGKCIAVEDITVPAGTFNCHKINQTYNTTIMGIKTTMRTITWYAAGVGIVKSETYDKKEKLQSVNELQSIVK
jgi:hypothetical protein